MMDDYGMGIIWACGTMPGNDGRLLVRHRDKHYPDHIARLTGNKVYRQESRTGPVWAVKISTLRLYDLLQQGWTQRTVKLRHLPPMVDYRAFIRAWVETHGVLDYSTRHRKDGTWCKRLRLRVIGGQALMSGIVAVVAAGAGVANKTVETVRDEQTGLITYTAYTEIAAILSWLSGDPCNATWWAAAYDRMAVPELNAEQGVNP